ncbi:MAG: UbiA family prenyltransferase [Phycisphaerales bacterium JB064]
MYAAGITAGALVLAGAALDVRGWTLSIALVFTIAWMAYILDRVKVLRRWQDPADRMANPGRDDWVARNRRALLACAGLLGLAALVLAALVDPWLTMLVPAGAASVIVYGSRPSESRRVRPKDVLVLKNVLTGLAYATLVGCVLWAMLPDARGLWRALAVVALVVTGDAMLCDIDDTPSDASFGTTTVAVLAGRHWATALAVVVYAAAVVVWMKLGLRTAGPGAFALGMPATGLVISRLGRVRTPIDLRGGAIGLLALFLMP